MRILDRYIIKTVLKTFLGCIMIFISLYVIVDIFGHLDEILKQRLSLADLGQYYLSFVPIIFVQITPIACLLATLYTLGNLTRHNEIVAMRTSGLSIFQITQTLIIFGIMVSILVFLVNEKFVPTSLNLVEKAKIKARDKSKQAGKKEVIENLSMYGLKNRLFFVDKFSLVDDTMERITILEQDEHHNLTKKVVANKGVWEDGLWKFHQSLTYNFDENGGIKGNPQYLEEEIMDIAEDPQDFLSQRRHPELMNIPQLKDYIFRLSTSGAKAIVRNFLVDLYNRFTYPFTSLVIIIVGIPFALRIKGKMATLSSFGISFTLGFLYYVSNAISLASGKAGFLAPLIAASAGHILFLCLGLYLICSLR